jgi:mannose-6-phosphate isomerase
VIFPLTNVIRPYAWGSHTAIAELLGEPSPTSEPQAEVWIGAHPDDPSRLPDGESLDARIAADPAAELGTPTVEALGPRLPFLVKLLAAAQPLSLQVHPTIEQAKAGYAEEEERGVDRSDPARNYKDDNHKPEMICAVTPFTGLMGFRQIHRTRHFLECLDVGGFNHVDGILAAAPTAEGLREAVCILLNLPADERRALVADLAKADQRSGHEYHPERRCVAALARAYPEDAGVAVAVLMNLVRLQPGEAVFLPAGMIHSYLTGLGVEVLANSDNVLRGGLTPKHIDVPELLDVLDATPADPRVLSPRKTGHEHRYDVPAREFRLGRIPLRHREHVDLGRTTGAQVVVATAGTVDLEQGGQRVALPPGHAAYLPDSTEPLVLSGHGEAHRCTVNLDAPGVA